MPENKHWRGLALCQPCIQPFLEKLHNFLNFLLLSTLLQLASLLVGVYVSIYLSNNNIYICMYVRVGSLEATPALGFKGAPIGGLNGIVGGHLHMTLQKSLHNAVHSSQRASTPFLSASML